ncbi:hypothetical protein FHS72_002180 [Loktanella ponticola]|uniref:Excalibur calcium-binding domain-containing protein n=1 Tax=Yoonia ponticola TaxID=1524255 RepID=A0A7W9BL71_9RHOB|nr:hypothetical protein [Yoonia ponticola]
MKIGTFGLVAAFALSACAMTPPAVPDSGRGVGFGDYAEFELDRARREAQLTSQQGGAPLSATRQPVAAASVPATANQAIPSSDLAAAGIGANAASTAGVSTAPLNALASDPVGETDEERERRLANNPQISDENNFAAVSSRETIESDAERRAEQAQALIVVEPVPLPEARADSGPNIVSYAINAPNQKGQEWYARSILSGESRFSSNCATYGSPDAAQRDFLTRGGPERDPRGIDPDGDGFACGWDPAPFRAAAGN